MPPIVQKPRTIGIWGHYGGHNQGDDCTVAAIIQHVRRRCPDAKLFGFSLYPSDTTQRHGMPSFCLRFPEPKQTRLASEASDLPPRGDWLTRRRQLAAPPIARPNSAKERFRRAQPALFEFVKKMERVLRSIFSVLVEPLRLVQSYRHLRGIEMLIVSGSQPLMDCWEGTWWHPYSVFRWSVLARLTITKVVFLSVGAGPLDLPLARRMIRWSLRHAFYRSYRDAFSKTLVEGLGIEGENHVFPDSVFSLEIPPPANPARHRLAGQRRLIVGLNPMAHEDPRYFPLGEAHRYENYIRKMADFAEWLIRNNCQVGFFYPDIFDARACDDVRALLEKRTGLNLDEYLDNCPFGAFDDLIARIRTCDVLVSARFHGLILSMMLEKPVLALAYNRKTVELMKGMGQEEYCLDIDRAEVSDLIARFEKIEGRRDSIAEALRPRLLENRRALEAQYDMLFGPSPNAAAASDVREQGTAGAKAINNGTPASERVAAGQ